MAAVGLTFTSCGNSGETSGQRTRTPDVTTLDQEYEAVEYNPQLCQRLAAMPTVTSAYADTIMQQADAILNMLQYEIGEIEERTEPWTMTETAEMARNLTQTDAYRQLPTFFPSKALDAAVDKDGKPVGSLLDKSQANRYHFLRQRAANIEKRIQRRLENLPVEQQPDSVR